MYAEKQHRTNKQITRQTCDGKIALDGKVEIARMPSPLRPALLGPGGILTYKEIPAMISAKSDEQGCHCLNSTAVSNEWERDGLGPSAAV